MYVGIIRTVMQSSDNNNNDGDNDNNNDNDYQNSLRSRR